MNWEVVYIITPHVYTPGLTYQVLPLLQKQPGVEGAASGAVTQLAVVTYPYPAPVPVLQGVSHICSRDLPFTAYLPLLGKCFKLIRYRVAVMLNIPIQSPGHT